MDFINAAGSFRDELWNDGFCFGIRDDVMDDAGHLDILRTLWPHLYLFGAFDTDRFRAIHGERCQEVCESTQLGFTAPGPCWDCAEIWLPWVS